MGCIEYLSLVLVLMGGYVATLKISVINCNKSGEVLTSPPSQPQLPLPNSPTRYPLPNPLPVYNLPITPPPLPCLALCSCNT